MIDDTTLEDQIGGGITPGGLEVDALIGDRRIEEAVRDDDLFERPLDTEPGSLVRLKQAALDPDASHVLAGRIPAEQANTVTEAVLQDAALDDEILGPILDLDSMRLLVGIREARAVAVDDEVCEAHPPAIVPEADLNSWWARLSWN